MQTKSAALIGFQSELSKLAVESSGPNGGTWTDVPLRHFGGVPESPDQAGYANAIRQGLAGRDRSNSYQFQYVGDKPRKLLGLIPFGSKRDVITSTIGPDASDQEISDLSNQWAASRFEGGKFRRSGTMGILPAAN